MLECHSEGGIICFRRQVEEGIWVGERMERGMGAGVQKERESMFLPQTTAGSSSLNDKTCFSVLT